MARTDAVAGGGTAPVWLEANHNSVLRLQLPAPHAQTQPQEQPQRLVVEVWNENTMLDDLIGRTDLPLPSHSVTATRFHRLDTGGDIAISVTRTTGV